MLVGVFAAALLVLLRVDAAKQYLRVDAHQSVDVVLVFRAAVREHTERIFVFRFELSPHNYDSLQELAYRK